MIKVFLVDDEAIARINLKHLIDWEKKGFIICGEADNAIDALRRVEELTPDVIFTDMNMPGMNGVEFIKKARNIVPFAKVIAFSAFDDFEFVRQSLKEGAVDYLIKYKMEPDSLGAMLETIKDSIKHDTIEKQKNDRIKEMASSGKTLIQKNVIMNFLNGYIVENFMTVIKEYEIDLDDRNLIVAASRIDDFHSIKERFNAQEMAVFIETINNILTNICEEIGKTVYTCIEEGKYVFIMSFSDVSSESLINSRAVANIGTIENTVKRFLNVTFSFGLSGICASISKISDYYNESKKVLDDGYFKGSNYIIQKRELVNRNIPNYNTGLTASEEKNLISFIRGSKRDEVTKFLEDLFKEIMVNKCPFDTVKMTCIDLINILNRMVKEFGISSKRIYSNSSSSYDELKKFENLDELLDYFKLSYNSLMDELDKNKLNNCFSTIVKRAMEYIISNYEKDISLSCVAEKVNVSPQYLSKLFKEEFNKGFTSCLNSIRIEQAKLMMEEGVALKSLAQNSGFNSYTYFFTVFKEFTGMTPQQYEKTLIKGRI